MVLWYSIVALKWRSVWNDIFKMWLTPLIVEHRLLEYEDAARTVVSAIAAGLALTVLVLICFRIGLLKRRKS